MPAALTVEVARLLQALREVLEGVEVADRVRPEEVADVATIDVGEIALAPDPLEIRLETVERLQPPELIQRRLEAHGLVATEPDPIAEAVGQQLIEVGRQLGEVPAQPVVAQQGVDRVLELGALLRRERPHQ